MSTALFSSIDDLAQFCAALVREHVRFEVRPTGAAGYYEVVFTDEATR